MTLERSRAPQRTHGAALRSAALQSEFSGLLQKGAFREMIKPLRFRISLNAESEKSEIL